MVEWVGDFEWRGEGEEAEVAVYAPDAAAADRALRGALPATRLPGVESPVHAAASQGGFGLVAVSGTHAAPDLFSAPEWGLLLVADAPATALGVPFEHAPRLLARGLSEVVPPPLGERALRDLSETGALWAAGEGLIEEEDLAPFGAGRPGARLGDPDSLGRRAISAGTRDWTRPGRVGVFRVAEVLDAETAGEMSLEAEALVLVVGAAAEDLGRLALAGHRDRISTRDFGALIDPPAAPVVTEEARDLLFASHAAANFAAGRAALVLWALRRVVKDASALHLRAAWAVGGIEERDEGRFFHRDGLAVVGEGEVLVSGRNVVAGTGGMSRSAPPFGASGEAPEGDGGWPWEEAGLCQRIAFLEAGG